MCTVPYIPTAPRHLTLGGPRSCWPAGSAEPQRAYSFLFLCLGDKKIYYVSTGLTACVVTNSMGVAKLVLVVLAFCGSLAASCCYCAFSCCVLCVCIVRALGRHLTGSQTCWRHHCCASSPIAAAQRTAGVKTPCNAGVAPKTDVATKYGCDALDRPATVIKSARRCSQCLHNPKQCSHALPIATEQKMQSWLFAALGLPFRCERVGSPALSLHQPLVSWRTCHGSLLCSAIVSAWLTQFDSFHSARMPSALQAVA